jgi:hypothetical protein
MAKKRKKTKTMSATKTTGKKGTKKKQRNFGVAGQQAQLDKQQQQSNKKKFGKAGEQQAKLDKKWSEAEDPSLLPNTEQGGR